jgi:hypothetical protein
MQDPRTSGAESFSLISEILCSERDYEVNGFLVSGWSPSLGVPCLPRLYSLIPHSSFLPLLPYCSEVPIATRPGLSKSYKREVAGEPVCIEYSACLHSIIPIGTSFIRTHLSLLASLLQ